MAHPDHDPVAARRALAHALGAYLDRVRVRDAVALWSAHFEGQGSLFVALNRYCRQVAESYGLVGLEAELHLRVFRALQGDPRALPDDPLSQPPGDDERTAPAALDALASAGPPSRPGPPRSEPPSGSGAGSHRSAALLQVFYAAIESQLARDLPPGITPARVRRTLIKHAAGLPRPQQHAASLWWSNQVSVLGGDWPAGGHGTALVNVIYVSLAELVGPVRADQCFTQAVARLERGGDPAHAEIRRYL
ncbi:MAG TPA: hypothetical protein VLI72_05835 [Methylibium sp.]|nr:hypothetical protein [Methylibium sp.]